MIFLEFPEKFNMADYFLYQNVEKGRENKICLYFEERTYTYGQAVRMANRVGNALRELGLEIEDRLLISLPDSPEFVWTWFGASRIGAVITMVSPQLKTADYAYYLNYTRATVAVISEDQLPAFQPAANKCPYLKNLLVVGASADQYKNFDLVVSAMKDEITPADTHRDDVAIWLFTSGSMGEPKACIHLHHDLPYSAENYAKRTMGFLESDITVAVPKLFFSYATGTNLLFPFSVGASTVLFSERSTPERIFQVIERYRPTILTNVPTMISNMLEFASKERVDLSSLRMCLSAGEALPVELYKGWKKAFDVEIYDGIGSTEMFHIYITNRPGDVRPGSLGRVVFGYTTKTVNAQGEELKSGEIGALMVKGDSAATGYWHNHERSKRTFVGDWCVTGDQFSIDSDGYHWYRGRTDEMLKVSGIYVSPYEIEQSLLEHSAVLECVVTGRMDDAGLIKPSALVVLKSGVEPCEELRSDLRAHVELRLARYKSPRWIEFVPSLPRNERGKIDRKLIKAASKM
jgi:benzoate-CoA ligase family protein